MGNVNDVSLPIARVTLLEDRARITRRGSAVVPLGVSRVRIESISPVVVDKSISAVVVGEGGSVVDVTVVRRVVQHRPDADAEPGSHEQLQAEGERLDREITSLLDDKTLLERRVGAVDEMANLVLDELAEDVAWGRSVDDGWASRLDRLRSEERELRDRIFELSEKLKGLYTEHDLLGMRLAALHDSARKESAALEIVVDAQTEEVALEVEYTTPGACWRPYHLATLRNGGDAESLVFRTDACVWQNTGEDWDEVELSFSTERPSLGIEPPRLTTDMLTVRRKSSQVVVETREEEVHTTGLGATTAVVAADLPGVDDGGELVKLKAPQRANVPSDGRPHRVMLVGFESAATTELVASPELSPCVFLKSLQTNESAAPLLAGPVDLIRDSGLVGRASILYVAPGERFELGWGPEAEVRVKRIDESLREKSRMLSSWITQGYKVEILISNLGDRARNVRVRERIPVSETEKVKIDLDSKESSPGTRADAEGYVDWQIEVSSFEQETRTLRYTVKRHEDVVGL